jgi:hypothetical protein
MSDCLHCDIHEMLASRLQGEQVDLAEIAAQVTEVLADLILLAPPDERTALMADVMANLGGDGAGEEPRVRPDQYAPFEPLMAARSDGA